MINLSLLKYTRDTIDDLFVWSPTSVKCRFLEHTVEAVLTAREITLFIDNNRVASSKVYLYPSTDTALLRGNIRSGDRLHLIDVYGKSGIFSASLKICINGERVAGAQF
jgi:hypothetical protein